MQQREGREALQGLREHLVLPEGSLKRFLDSDSLYFDGNLMAMARETSCDSLLRALGKIPPMSFRDVVFDRP